MYSMYSFFTFTYFSKATKFVLSIVPVAGQVAYSELIQTFNYFDKTYILDD